MFGKVYHIAVAVCAVSLLVVLIFGALFVVIQGLVAHFLAVDIWTPVADALAPLFGDLAEWARELWQELLSWIEEAAGTSNPGPEPQD